MKRMMIVAAPLIAAGVAMAAFDDLSDPAYKGKIDIKKANAVIDANFAKIESGVGGGASSLNVTNGQAITVSSAVYVLNGIGGANDTTNTVTLAAPSVAGQKVTLLAAAGTTNLITIADSGTVAASGAILLDGNDTAVLQANGTNNWCLISESDN